MLINPLAKYIKEQKIEGFQLHGDDDYFLYPLKRKHNKITINQAHIRVDFKTDPKRLFLSPAHFTCYGCQNDSVNFVYHGYFDKKNTLIYSSLRFESGEEKGESIAIAIPDNMQTQLDTLAKMNIHAIIDPCQQQLTSYLQQLDERMLMTQADIDQLSERVFEGRDRNVINLYHETLIQFLNILNQQLALGALRNQKQISVLRKFISNHGSIATLETLCDIPALTAFQETTEPDEKDIDTDDAIAAPSVKVLDSYAALAAQHQKLMDKVSIYEQRKQDYLAKNKRNRKKKHRTSILKALSSAYQTANEYKAALLDSDNPYSTVFYIKAERVARRLFLEGRDRLYIQLRDDSIAPSAELQSFAVLSIEQISHLITTDKVDALRYLLQHNANFKVDIRHPQTGMPLLASCFYAKSVKCFELLLKEKPNFLLVMPNELPLGFELAMTVIPDCESTTKMQLQLKQCLAILPSHIQKEMLKTLQTFKKENLFHPRLGDIDQFTRTAKQLMAIVSFSDLKIMGQKATQNAVAIESKRSELLGQYDMYPEVQECLKSIHKTIVQTKKLLGDIAFKRLLKNGIQSINSFFMTNVSEIPTREDAIRVAREADQFFIELNQLLLLKMRAGLIAKQSGIKLKPISRQERGKVKRKIQALQDTLEQSPYAKAMIEQDQMDATIFNEFSTSVRQICDSLKTLENTLGQLQQMFRHQQELQSTLEPDAEEEQPRASPTP